MTSHGGWEKPPFLFFGPKGVQKGSDTMRFREVMRNLRRIGTVPVRYFGDEIITAFEDYQFRGENYVQISEEREIGWPDSDQGMYRVEAYVNHIDSPHVEIRYTKFEEDGTKMVKVERVW